MLPAVARWRERLLEGQHISQLYTKDRDDKSVCVHHDRCTSFLFKLTGVIVFYGSSSKPAIGFHVEVLLSNLDVTGVLGSRGNSFYNTNSTHRLCAVFQPLGLILQRRGVESLGSVLVLLCSAERDHAPTHYRRNGATDWARWGRGLGL